MAMEALLIKSKRLRADQKASHVMIEAKKALIAYAAMDAGINSNFGNLPCPFTGLLSDYQSASVATPTCGDNDGLMVIGFFPWQTLRVPPLLDGDNAPLWYAVSGAFKVGSGQTMPYTCNPNSNLTINGSGNHAAILFSPGDPIPFLTLPIQNRPLTNTATFLRNQFLEERNATASVDFQVTRIMTTTEGGVSAPPFNDRLLGITCEEIIQAINLLPP